MQERCNSIANALELRLSCTNPSIWCQHWSKLWWAVRISTTFTILVLRNDWKCQCILNTQIQPSHTVWCYESWSTINVKLTIIQVNTCCLMAPNHNPNQCRSIISFSQEHNSVKLFWKFKYFYLNKCVKTYMYNNLSSVTHRDIFQWNYIGNLNIFINSLWPVTPHSRIDLGQHWLR